MSSLRPDRLAVNGATPLTADSHRTSPDHRRRAAACNGTREIGAAAELEVTSTGALTPAARPRQCGRQHPAQWLGRGTITMRPPLEPEPGHCL